MLSTIRRQSGTFVGRIGFALGCVLASMTASATAIHSEVSAQIQGSPLEAHSSDGTLVAPYIQAKQFQQTPLGGGGILALSGASARVGSLSTLTTNNANAPAETHATASAQWIDSFVINGGVSGSQGTFSGSALVVGNMFVQAQGNTIASSSFISASLIVDTGIASYSEQESASHILGVGVDQTSGGPQTLLSFSNLAFVFGQPITITLQTAAQSGSHTAAGAGGLADGFSIASAGSDMNWQGTTNVRDQQGTLVTGYTAISAGSGYDFTLVPTPVPEPATWLSCLVGLGMLRYFRGRHPWAIRTILPHSP